MLWRYSKCKNLRIQRFFFFAYNKNFPFFYETTEKFHSIKNEDFYFDYHEDEKILRRIRNDEMNDILSITDEKNFLRIKKKYLKLMKVYHPDTYLNEQNELRRKNKEEIFRQIYKRYKAISTENIKTYESEFDRIDESVYEKEEEKRERMEKYKRYSEGKRNDITNINIEIYTLISICSVFIGVFLFCIYFPFNVEPSKEEFYENREKWKIETVSCFYNPVLQRYEHFSENFSPPLPDQLYYFYKTNFPGLPLDEDLLKMKPFEIVKLPKNKTKRARLVYDKKQKQLVYIKKKK